MSVVAIAGYSMEDLQYPVWPARSSSLTATVCATRPSPPHTWNRQTRSGSLWTVSAVLRCRESAKLGGIP
jgi:hypothetical protein